MTILNKVTNWFKPKKRVEVPSVTVEVQGRVFEVQIKDSLNRSDYFDLVNFMKNLPQNVIVSAFDQAGFCESVFKEVLNDFRSVFIIYDENTAIAGFGGLAIDRKGSNADDALLIIRPDCQGKGIGFAVCRKLIEHSLSSKGINVCKAYVNPKNIKSKKMMEKLAGEYQKKLDVSGKFDPGEKMYVFEFRRKTKALLKNGE